jgi:urea transporter
MMPSRDKEDSVLNSLRNLVNTWWLRVGQPFLEENWRFGLMVLVAIFAAMAAGAYFGW